MYSIEELVAFEKKAEQAMFHFKKNFNYSRVDEFDLICDFKKKVLKIVFNQLSWWDEGGGNGGSFSKDPICSFDVSFVNLTPDLFLENVIRQIDGLRPSIERMTG